MAVYRANRPRKRIIFHAQTSSLTPQIQDVSKGNSVLKADTCFSEIGFFSFIADSPEGFAGKRVLIMHGDHKGMLPNESIKAMGDSSVSIIYCCYPKPVNRNSQDTRIQWTTVDRKLLARIEEDKDHLVITIMEGKE